MIILGLDIGSNSVGSAWVDTDAKAPGLHLGVSVFPAGVDEADDKRGEPKNVKRRTTRRTRVTLSRRAERKRLLRLKLGSAGLLPAQEGEFRRLLDTTDAWVLRRRGLSEPLTPHEFGRVLLHLSQRRGTMGFDSDADDKGKVKSAITHVQLEMLDRYGSPEERAKGQHLRERVETLTKKKGRTDEESAEVEKACEELKSLCRSLLERKDVTCGRLLADLQDERDRGTYKDAIRNRRDSFEFHADRSLIRDEFRKLWEAQKRLGGPLAGMLTDELRTSLDDESGDTIWRHQGLLFGQRRTYWDTGSLGRCVLEPTERCVPQADMYASRFLVVETVNNLRIIERGRTPRPLTDAERQKIKDYLCGPLGMEKGRRGKGDADSPSERPKTSVSVTDLRNLMGTSEEGWGRATKNSRYRFNIEADEERTINTDWFSREIVHGAITPDKWAAMPERTREGINRAILKYQPENEKDADALRAGVMKWAGLDETEADRLVRVWRNRPKLEKRLNLSRRAIRNLLVLMDRAEPWPDPENPGQGRWLTAIEARKLIAEDGDFKDTTTGDALDLRTRWRYATGTKGATARDRHYMKKHLLKKNGEVVLGPDGTPLAEPPPAPLLGNPVVRKAIHEVRRHLIEYMTRFERKPDAVSIELAREARMGKQDADRLLLRNRLRNRIRRDIIRAFKLEERSSTQQRAGVDRVILCVQQNNVCALCGNQAERNEITLRMAADGDGCEVAHIVPRACGGHNGLGNLVLAHTKCNRDMRRRTPRQFWNDVLKGGFEEGLLWIEHVYGDIERPLGSESKTATGNSLWQCYFTRRDDLAKIEQFKKDVKDVQGMTGAQKAATQYATRQVMAYLADALYGGKGLPERGGDRRIFTTDGLWTSRLRREWGLFFDPHGARAKGLNAEAEHERKEKNRGDHRHHAIDAVVTALGSRDMQMAWEERERKADREGINTADEEAMETYRRSHPLPPPIPFKDREEFREAVRGALFGEKGVERPVCHRAVKRKIIGALHEETLFGPVLDKAGRLTENYTAKKSILGLDSNHLRMPRPETPKEAIERLAARRRRQGGAEEKAARKWAKTVVSSPGYRPTTIDPPPGKSGIIRDIALRKVIRECLASYEYVEMNRRGEPTGKKWFVDPDTFTENELKQAVESGAIHHPSGIPIRSVVLLRTMSDPVVIDRKRADYATGRMHRDDNPTTKRAYVGGNNHHIEIRVARDKKGRETLAGAVVPAFKVANELCTRLRELAKIEKPIRHLRMALTREERKGLSSEQIRLESKRRVLEWKQVMQELRPQRKAIIAAHPLVNRSDNEDGEFVMSLCEGEMVMMKHKHKDEVGYFVVAKLDKPQSIVLVPHWDARAATARKDAEGNKILDSVREQFAVTPTDLKELAPPGHAHAVKVRVSPLGAVRVLVKD